MCVNYCKQNKKWNISSTESKPVEEHEAFIIVNIVFIVFNQNGTMSHKIMFLFYLKDDFFVYTDVIYAYKITSID